METHNFFISLAAKLNWLELYLEIVFIITQALLYAGQITLSTALWADNQESVSSVIMKNKTKHQQQKRVPILQSFVNFADFFFRLNSY